MKEEYYSDEDLEINKASISTKRELLLIPKLLSTGSIGELFVNINNSIL
ncbi:hypothetical protein HYD61_02940 [Mycoplasmopsis bovis]|nr:hypothetical protein [Mycoplasmopsis bovis]QQH60620.1 hypothetical protein HYD61_02940 [Mycoplasmopsis bovis]